MALSPAQQAIVDSLSQRMTTRGSGLDPLTSLHTPSAMNGREMYAPSMAGNVPPRSVPATSVGAIKPGPVMVYNAALNRPVSEFQQFVGSYGNGNDRLAPGPAGIGSGTGLTPQQVAALGGWGVDPRTGALGYTEPHQVRATPASQAAAQLASVPMPRSRPNVGVPTYKGPTPIEDKLIAKGIIPDTADPNMIAASRRQQPVKRPTVNITVGGGRKSPVMVAPVPAPRPVARPVVGSNGYVYQNGQQIGTSRPAGMTPAQQYEAANAMAAARARAAASNPSYQSSGGGGDWFSSVTRA